MACMICKSVDCAYGRATALTREWNQAQLRAKEKAARKIFGFLQLLLLACVTAFVLSGCHLASIRVTVQPDVPGNHIDIENEIRAGLEFFCQQKGVDRCDYWASGLEIDVRAEPDAAGNWGQMIFAGDDLWVTWNGGLRYNALFHELLHRYYRHGQHGDAFAAEWQQMQLDWAVQEGL